MSSKNVTHTRPHVTHKLLGKTPSKIMLDNVRNYLTITTPGAGNLSNTNLNESKHMETITFNTGRMYGQQGQRIAAVLLDTGSIVFCDRDRHIEGLISAGGLTRDDVKQFKLFEQREIMRAYDAGDYINADNLGGNFSIQYMLRALADNVKGA